MTGLSLVSTVATVIPNYISGLTLSTAGSSATFTTAAGSAADSTNAKMIVLAASIAKTTGTWAVGTGNGSLDTGTIANSTWYHAYEIVRADTGVVDILTSLNATSPALPANYTLFRRIGAMFTDGSAHWTGFTQIANEFLWNVVVASQVGVTPGTDTATNYVVATPLGVNTIAKLRGLYTGTLVGDSVLIYSPTVTSANAGGPNATVRMNVAATPLAYTVDVRTDTSSQVRASGNSGSNTLSIDTYGWIDLRGQT